MKCNYCGQFHAHDLICDAMFEMHAYSFSREPVAEQERYEDVHPKELETPAAAPTGKRTEISQIPHSTHPACNYNIDGWCHDTKCMRDGRCKIDSQVDAVVAACETAAAPPAAPTPRTLQENVILAIEQANRVPGLERELAEQCRINVIISEERDNLEDQLATAQAALQAARMDAERYRGGLAWYAAHNHIELPDWETEEGWYCPPNEESWMVEDGGVARSILAGCMMNPNTEDQDFLTILPDSAIAAGKGVER